MEEIRQMKANKMKEKGSQHDPKNAANKEETPVGGWPAEHRTMFHYMAEVAALLE